MTSQGTKHFMSEPLPQVRLKIVRRSSHPWIFQKMVEKPADRFPGGSVVDIIDRDGKWAGRGFYNGHSRIALRLLTTDPAEAIDDAFFARRIEPRRRAAPRLAGPRRRHRRLSPGSFRGRWPERPGGRSLRLDPGAWSSSPPACIAFEKPSRRSSASTIPDSQFYWFAEEHVQKQESFDCRPPEPPPPATITEHGVRFRVAPGSKHKTGFFLDQRDNRQALASFCARQARARSVLQHRRLRGLRQGAWAAPRKWSAWTWTSRSSRWPSKTPT